VGQFKIYLSGRTESVPLEVPVTSVHEIERIVGAARFLAGELIDVPDEDGVCSNRAALIPISRIQMIMEGD
jgi:hypothetical protein